MSAPRTWPPPLGARFASDRRLTTMTTNGGQDDVRLTDAPLAGAIGLSDIGSLRARFAAATRTPASVVRMDLSRVESMDGGAAAILVALGEELRARGVEVVFEGARGRVHSLIDLYEAHGAVAAPKAPPSRHGILDEVGRAVMKVVVAARDDLEFLGEVLAAFGAMIRRPWSVRWRDTAKAAEAVGANGLPVVALVSLLVGFIIAFQSAGELRKYGANLMIADLVAITMTREMAPIMAAIITIARSGSAYTAELGTMKVTEEIDALRALGLSPVRFLVIPRVLAMVFVVPVLTLFASVIGVLGGLSVAVGLLELTVRGYVVECQQALVPRDLVFGLVKSTAFGLSAALIACQRGLATRGGAAGVGRATTRAVVFMIVAVMALDALFAFFWNLFKL